MKKFLIHNIFQFFRKMDKDSVTINSLKMYQKIFNTVLITEKNSKTFTTKIIRQ